MEDLNARTFTVKAVKDPFSFEIDLDSSTVPSYEGGATCTEVKQPTPVEFEADRAPSPACIYVLM